MEVRSGSSVTQHREEECEWTLVHVSARNVGWNLLCFAAITDQIQRWPRSAVAKPSQDPREETEDLAGSDREPAFR